MSPAEITERFFRRVVIEPNSGCWLWTGSLAGGGYGKFHYSSNRRNQKAHRVSYEIHVGPIPQGLVIDHKCRTRCCVNPHHLEPVTNLENIRRGLAGADGRAKTHCPRGHEYTPENTRQSPRTIGRLYARHCRACDIVRWAERAKRSRPKGETHHSAKLTDEQVRAILASSEPTHALATLYGVHQTHITRIQRGARWKHLRLTEGATP